MQLASYGEERVAASLAKKLKNKGYDAYVTVAKLNGKQWHRVRIGRFGERAEAEKVRDAKSWSVPSSRAVSEVKEDGSGQCLKGIVSLF